MDQGPEARLPVRNETEDLRLSMQGYMKHDFSLQCPPKKGGIRHSHLIFETAFP